MWPPIIRFATMEPSGAIKSVMNSRYALFVATYRL
jgi:hypothetical protein